MYFFILKKYEIALLNYTFKNFLSVSLKVVMPTSFTPGSKIRPLLGLARGKLFPRRAP
jgi:hypothetical protein